MPDVPSHSVPGRKTILPSHHLLLKANDVTGRIRTWESDKLRFNGASTSYKLCDSGKLVNFSDLISSCCLQILVKLEIMYVKCLAFSRFLTDAFYILTMTQPSGRGHGTYN